MRLLKSTGHLDLPAPRIPNHIRQTLEEAYAGGPDGKGLFDEEGRIRINFHGMTETEFKILCLFLDGAQDEDA